MALTRYNIKALLFQAIVQDTAFVAWVVDYHSSLTTTQLVAELGSNVPSTQVKYPAIRYKIVSDLPESTDREGMRTVIFDIYMENRDENSDQADDLMGIVRDIFVANKGRALGVFSESSAYATAIGDSDKQVRVWDVREVANEQIKSSEERGRNSRDLRLETKGEIYFSMIRFTSTMADWEYS